MIAVATYHQLIWLAVLSLAARRTFAFVAIGVEFDPVATNAATACSSSFLSDFGDNLTMWVVDSARSNPFLSDFSIPGGIQVSSFNSGQRRTRSRGLNAQTGFNKCSSKGCDVNLIGACRKCGTGRRRRGLQGTTNLANSTASVDWVTVGADVTNLVTPSLIHYLVVNQDASAGCLGDPNVLGFKVTFLSDPPLDAALEEAMITAFAAPTASSTKTIFAMAAAAVPTESSKPSTKRSGTAGCCTRNFKRCIGRCTKAQASSSGSTDVVWMPQGPPKDNKCLARFGECTHNELGCCPGTKCLGDEFRKGCFYVPPSV